MATLDEARRPYELLVRWDVDGALQGAHAQFRTVVTRDGVPVSDAPEPPIPLALAGEAGFPLADVLAQSQTDALAQIEALQTALARAQAERDAAIAELDGVQSRLTAASA